MVENIKAIAFDIDGTLYSSFKFYLKISGYVLKNYKFFISF